MKVMQIALGNGYNDRMDEGYVHMQGETGTARIKLTEAQVSKLVAIARTFMPEVFTGHIDAMKNARADLLALPHGG